VTEKQFGHYDDVNKEYVITTPNTPSPWINYLGCEEFFSLFSHTGGGYCFFQDARLRRLTRYRYNNIPLDSNGRYFYLRDEEDGKYWSVGHAPVRRPLDSFQCRHGFGYSLIESCQSDIKTSLLAFVPLGRSAEVLQVTVRNEGSRPRKLKLFSFIEFCLWNALEDMTNFQRNLSTGEVEVEGSTIYHITEYRERRNHFAYFHVNHEIAGYDTSREAFVGPYQGLDAPEAVVEGIPRNSHASGWSPIASHCLEVCLAPGESKDYVFVLGYAENEEQEKWLPSGVINKTPVKETLESLRSPEQVEAELKLLKQHWNDQLGHYRLETSDRKLARMVNDWNPYQCMVTFNLSRSASYYESGIGRGMGFRDSNQDLLGVFHMVPERARQRILDLAATQLPNGSAYHQYQPLTKKGNHDIGSGFNDDPLWLVLAVCEYTKETGDYGLLDELTPYDNDINQSFSLLDHLHRAFDYVASNRGPHGLPLIGRADWNDCLNLNCHSTNPDESFQTTGETNGSVAESVFLAGLIVFVGNEFVVLLQKFGRDDEARRVSREVAVMRDAVMEHGFDGEWFLRAFDATSRPVGSAENAEGQIFVEPQGFCCMARIGEEEGFCSKALEMVDKRLASPNGIVLHHPAYTRYRPELGEITSYPPGYKENSSVFCHNNPWIIIANAMHGHGDRAYDYYRRIAPAFRDTLQQTHRAEPYVYAQMIAGPDAPYSGQAKNSWLTGAAAWNYVAITQYLLGVRPEHNGLRIRPKITREIGSFVVHRRCRNAEYEIRVRCANEGESIGLFIDNKSMPGDIIPYAEAGSCVVVECISHGCEDNVPNLIKAPMTT